MADKKFGVKQLDLIGTGTPTIQSANNLNLNATTTAISNDVTIGGDLTVTGSITGSSAGIPSGVIMLWSGAANAIPTGYVLCDGNNNTPNLIDRFVVGASNSTGDNTYPGLSPNATPGGSADATLVSHSHTVDTHNHGSGTLSASTGGSHTHSTGFGRGTDDQGGAGPEETYDWNSTSSYNTSPHNGHTHPVSGSTGNESPGTDDQGVSATNANLPPYYALCYIMKT